MREAYHEQLDEVTAGLVEMSRLAGTAIGRASTALLDADLALAESVIAADDAVDALYEEVESKAFDILALQAPVAGELRAVVAALRISATLERMADLAEHVAAVARRRYPASVVPPEMRSLLLEMGQVAERIVQKAGSVIASQDVDVALELEGDDDRMDHLHRKLLTTMLESSWDNGVETAIDLSQVSRYYERFADHAVSVARRVVFLVTGEKYEDLLAARAEQA
jgi:phosphate transport system protein